MPATIQQFGVRNPFSPMENIRAGVSYLRQLLDRYSNDEALALAAYNAGPGAVDRHGVAIPPYKETRDYVSKINRMAGRPVQVPGHEHLQDHRRSSTAAKSPAIRTTSRPTARASS